MVELVQDNEATFHLPLMIDGQDRWRLYGIIPATIIIEGETFRATNERSYFIGEMQP